MSEDNVVCNPKNEFTKDFKKIFEKLLAQWDIEWRWANPKLYIFSDWSYSQKRWKEESPEKAPTGWISWPDVYSANYALWIEKFGEGKDEYRRNLQHELLHVVYKVLTNNHVGPNWLWEGFAQYFSGDVVYEYSEELEFLNHYDDWNDIVYTQGGYLVKRLYEKFGHERFKELLKRVGEMDSPNSTEKVFADFYGKPMKELFTGLFEEST